LFHQQQAHLIGARYFNKGYEAAAGKPVDDARRLPLP